MRAICGPRLVEVVLPSIREPDVYTMSVSSRCVEVGVSGFTT
jgi:hypothetical protein